MSKTETLLADLRDIQLPPDPEGASVWLVTANILLLMIIAACIYRHWVRRREQWRRDALRKIHDSKRLPAPIALLELAKLLRQVVLYRQHDASATGQAWLNELDSAFNTNWFTTSKGQLFGNELYRPTTLTATSLNELCNQLARLIKKLPRNTPAASTAPAQLEHGARTRQPR